MHAILTGPSPRDPWSLGGEDKHQLSPALTGEDPSGIRIGYIELTANPRLATDVRPNTHDSLLAWRDMGAEVEEVTEKIDWIEFESRVLYQADFRCSAPCTCRNGRTRWIR
jgi:Asp-tRNA(Asn)/Glu-tRNA(Gln) amidotransferase A subunit family amidase